MKFKYILILTFGLTTIGFAQNSYVTQTPSKEIQSAFELFQLQKFAAAKDKFDQLKDFSDNQDAIYDNLSAQAYLYSGICAYELRNNDAEILLKQFLKKYKNHALANYAKLYLGKYYFDQKNHKKTIKYLEEVSALNLKANEQTTLHFMLGYTYFFKKDFKSSKVNFVKIYDKPSAYFYQSNYYLGYMAYLNKSYDFALKHFIAIKKSKMYKNIVPFYIIQIYFTQGKYSKVIENAEDIIEDPNFKYQDETINLLGQAYYQTRKFQLAIPYLKEYIQNASEVLKSDIYNLGYCYYQQDSFLQAKNLLTKLSESNDSLGQNANYLLGECFLKLNDKQSAKSAYFKASKENHDSKIKETSSFNYAKLSFELAYHHEAIENIQNFLTDYPYSRYTIEAKELLAQILLNTKNYEFAMEIIEGIENPTLKLKTAYQKVCYYRGVELFNEDYLDASIALFNRSLENPYDKDITAKAHYWKAEALYVLERFDEATADYILYTEAAPVAQKLNLIEHKAYAYYSLAYAFYNQKKYAQARTYFSFSKKEFEDLPDTLKQTIAYKKTQPDAILRLADCYYLMRDFDRALSYYKSIYEGKNRGADYALYQSALIFGLEGKKAPAKRIELLSKLIKEFSWSNYADDALYQMGDTYFSDGKSDSAIHYFKRVEDQHPGSLLGRKALLKLALIYFNDNALDQSKAQCSKLLTQYPETAEGKEAINIIKRIFVAKGEVEDLVILLKESFPHVKFSLDEQDSLSYYAAELQYQNDHYEAAEELFNKYRDQFPNGYFIINANYYSAECAFKDKRYNAALTGYAFLVNQQKNKYTETALLKSSFIYHKVKSDYKNAYKTFELLLNNAELKSSQLKAVRGLAKTAYHLKKNDKVKLYAQTLISLPDASPDDIIMSELFIGNGLMNEGYIDSALNYYEKVKSKTTNEYGIEARYKVAKAYYLKDQFDTSTTLCFDIIQNLPNYPNWLAKTFILLGMNYHALGNDFQAKATLQSIIDAYKGDIEIINDAKSKLKLIIDAEQLANANILDSVSLIKDSILVEEADSILLEYDTLIIGGDTLLIEKDEEFLETPEIKDSIIKQDSILKDNNIDTIPSSDTTKNNGLNSKTFLKIDSNKLRTIIEPIDTFVPIMDTIKKDSLRNE